MPGPGFQLILSFQKKFSPPDPAPLPGLSTNGKNLTSRQAMARPNFSNDPQSRPRLPAG